MLNQRINSTKFIVDNKQLFICVKLSFSFYGKVTFHLKGNSMNPFLKDGDLLTMVARQREKVKLGSIWLAEKDGSYVLHRLVRRCKDSLVLAGDANFVLKEKVHDANLIGMVYSVHRNGQEIDVNTIFMRLSGLVFFHLRPVRRIFSRTIKIFKKSQI